MRPWLPRRAGATEAGAQAAPPEKAPQAMPTEDGPGNGQVQTQPEIAATTAPPDVMVSTPEAQVQPPPPAEPTEPTEATEPTPSPAPPQAQSTPRRRSIVRSSLMWVWRTRGLWLGAVALALALYAQRVLTIDKAVIPSIRWYAVAIVVMLLAWAGTYKNKSLLVEPVRRTATRLATLPVRRQNAKPQPAPTLEPPAPAAPATTLPVRARRPATAPQADGAAPAETPADGKVDPVSASTSSNASASRSMLSRFLPSRANSQPNGIQPAPQTTSRPTTRFGRLLAPWTALTARYPILGGPWLRYALAFAALGLNLYSAGQLRGNYYSAVGGFGWLLSLVILAAVFLRERRKEARDLDESQADVEDTTRLNIPRRLEVAIFIGIFLLAFALRVYRLDDWTAGMHGDEGETGMDAINILEGRRVSPFLTGWFSHPNFSFWSVAISMGVFGASLFGLRIFSSILSTLMLVPFYLLVRMWFGTRAAIIATTLLAVMDVSIYFGKLGLNNITTPFFLVTGFYFLFRGLRSRRTLDFVLSGYGFMLTLYFYFGGRLTPILVAAVLGYMFLLLPIARIPGAYLQARRLAPSLGRLLALRDAAWAQARSVLSYGPQLILFVVACVCMASPWAVYYMDHRAEMEGRSNEKLIFNPNNQGRMGQQHAATHEPLYLGLRMPRPDDIYPVLPVVFEKTPLSVQVAEDGFWPRVIWGQTTTTLSVFTYREDASSFYTFTHEPAAKPIEAALLILGIAWALWRWRDSRMATLSIWFWGTLLSGGVLTIDSPYIPRMVGLVPTLAIFIAIPLNKICAELVGVVARFNERRKTKDEGRAADSSNVLRPSSSVLRPSWGVTLAHALTAGVLVGLLGYLSFQNATDYTRYMSNYAYTDVTGQAYFVRQMNRQAADEGRPTPKYYNLGIHVIYWSHGNNRFLNHGTPGEDMTNPTNELPVVDNEDRDVIFMVWDINRHYLPIIKEYYPGGEEGNFIYGPPGTANPLFVYYRVKKEQIEAQRRTIATYRPATGPALQREERALGSTSAPPSDLTYPVRASWAGSIVAPAFGRYRFSMDNNGDGNMLIDGTPVLTTTAAAPRAEVELVLARGPHDVQLSGTLADSKTQVTAKWLAGGSEFVAIPRQYLWYGPGKGLLGQILPFTGNLLDDPPPGPDAPRILAIRLDGFLGFRHSPDALTGGQLQARWSGTLNVAEAGHYQFSVNSNGESALFVDGKPVVQNLQVAGQAREVSGGVDLTQGDHPIEVRYNWSGGTGYLEAFWTPPGGERRLLGPDVLRAEGGIVDPTTLASEPFPVQLEGDSPPAKLSPEAIIGEGLSRPRGLAVDRAGNIYVGDRGNHRIVVFSPDGKVARTWGKQAPPAQEGQPPPKVQPGEFNQINDVAVLEDGTVYVLDNTPRVQVFRSSGEYIGSYEPEQLGLYGPNGITAGTMEGKSYLAIAATGQNRIAKYPPINEVLENKVTLPDAVQSITGSEADRMEQPVDTIARGGVFYAIDLKDRLVELRLKEGAEGQWEIAKQWRAPVGRDDGGSRLAMSPDGTKIYMSDIDRRRVAIIDLEGGAVTYFESGGRESEGGEFRAPSGIAVGPDGRLYVLDRERGNIQVFTIGGSSR